MDSEAAVKQLAREVDAAYNDADPAKMAGYWTENGLNAAQHRRRVRISPSYSHKLYILLD
jgi:hypothetical protein